MKPVTIRDVAKEAGVSIATVSAVTTGNRQVSNETLHKVKVAMEKLHYRSSRPDPSSSTVHRVAYIVPSLTNPVFAHLAQELQVNLNNLGYELFIISNEARVDLTKAFCNSMSLGLSGVIMTQTTTCGTIVAEACAKRKVPCVSLLAPDLPGVPCALGDEEQGVQLAVSHLVGYGHHDIGFLMVKGSKIHERRLLGFRRTLDENGLAFDTENVIECRTHDESDAYIHAKAYFANANPNFSALICCNDLLAFGASNAIREVGMLIPKDLSLIGYDDTVARYLYPSLTSVVLPRAKMATTAVHLLIDSIQNKPYQQRVLHPQSLVVRDSTGLKNAHTLGAAPVIAPISKAATVMR